MSGPLWVPDYRAIPASGAFNPQTDITWHSFFWAEGSAFQALSYSDGATLTNWPNETSESDADQILGTPTYDAVDANINDQPACNFSDTEGVATLAFTTNPSYTNDVSFVAVAWTTTITATRVVSDGITSTDRNMVYNKNTNPRSWSIFAGTEQQGTVTSANSTAVFLRAKFEGGTGNSTLHTNETSSVNADAGSQTITGLSIGRHATSTTLGINGGIPFVGVYEGDISADSEWSNFKTWVSDHYGITLA